jgi:hypothetical protein
MVLAKVVPIVPGHFTAYEWIALAIWGALGLLISLPRQLQRSFPGKKADLS